MFVVYRYIPYRYISVFYDHHISHIIRIFDNTYICLLLISTTKNKTIPPRGLKATGDRCAKYKCVDKVKKLCDVVFIATDKTKHAYHGTCWIDHSPHQVSRLQIRCFINYLLSVSKCEIQIPSNYMEDQQMYQVCFRI